MTVLSTVEDPDGRQVELTIERWNHVLDIHPELEELAEEVLGAVAQPTRRTAGRRPNEEWFYAEGLGPSRWLKVVVALRGAAAGS